MFKVGDLVLPEVLRYKTGQTKKFVPKYEIPYKVTIISGTTHSLEHMVTHKSYQAHYNRLKPYNLRNTI